MFPKVLFNYFFMAMFHYDLSLTLKVLVATIDALGHFETG